LLKLMVVVCLHLHHNAISNTGQQKQKETEVFIFDL